MPVDCPDCDQVFANLPDYLEHDLAVHLRDRLKLLKHVHAEKILAEMDNSIPQESTTNLETSRPEESAIEGETAIRQEDTVTIQKVRKVRHYRNPALGETLTKTHKGKTHTAKVVSVAEGKVVVEMNGKEYRSLSSAAKAATGSSANGWTFWGLEEKPEKEEETE